MAYRLIDPETYERKDHFRYFRSLPYPYAGVTVSVDVSSAVRYAKANGCSFFLLFTHAVSLAADRVPEMRRRIHGEMICEYDECPSSHTELLDNGTYCYCTLHHHMPLKEYLAEAEESRKKSRESASIGEDEDVESMYFISCLPWLCYTALVQPAAGGNESNPRISWGKYEEDASGRLMMPVSLLVHHGLADGLHIAAFYRHLENIVRMIGEGKDPFEEQ